MGETNEANTWPQRGLCANIFTEEGVNYWFTPEESDADYRSIGVIQGGGGFPSARSRRARQVCNACPVRPECLAYALARPEDEGIWGGLLPHERERLAESIKERLAASWPPPPKDDDEQAVPLAEWRLSEWRRLVREHGTAPLHIPRAQRRYERERRNAG